MLVMCVIKHSVRRAILEDIKAYIAVSALMPVQCVIGDSVIGAF